MARAPARWWTSRSAPPELLRAAQQFAARRVPVLDRTYLTRFASACCLRLTGELACLSERPLRSSWPPVWRRPSLPDHWVPRPVLSLRTRPHPVPQRPSRSRLRPRAAAAPACRPGTPCARRSPTRTSTSSWPTGSPTATPTMTPGGSPGDGWSMASTPTTDGLLQRRRPGGPAREDRLHPGSRYDLDLADPQLQEQGGAAGGRPLGRLPRLLDHRLHPDRPAPGHQRRAAGPGRRGARPRDEGLLRHHHQPHRRRDRLRGGRADRVRAQGRPEPYRDRVRPAVRRPRLRRHQQLPGARPGDVLPVHPGAGARRGRTSRCRAG